MKDLRTLAKLAETSFMERRAGLLSEYDLKEEDKVEKYKDPEIEDEYRKVRRTYFEDGFSFEVQLLDEPETTIGSVDGVLDEADRRTVSRLRFSGIFPPAGETLDITFARRPRFGSAVEMRIVSHDIAWGRSTFSRMSDEIEKGRPWWSGIHSIAGFIVLHGTLTLALAAGTLLAVVPNASLNGGQWLSLVYAIIVGCLILPLAITAKPVRERLFPRFEITGSGDRSTGSNVLVYVLTAILSLVIGLWVNIVS